VQLKRGLGYSKAKTYKRQGKKGNQSSRGTFVGYEEAYHGMEDLQSSIHEAWGVREKVVKKALTVWKRALPGVILSNSRI
jgi:hypothetical protein